MKKFIIGVFGSSAMFLNANALEYNNKQVSIPEDPWYVLTVSGRVIPTNGQLELGINKIQYEIINDDLSL